MVIDVEEIEAPLKNPVESKQTVKKPTLQKTNPPQQPDPQLEGLLEQIESGKNAVVPQSPEQKQPQAEQQWIQVQHKEGNRWVTPQEEEMSMYITQERTQLLGLGEKMNGIFLQALENVPGLDAHIKKAEGKWNNPIARPLMKFLAEYALNEMNLRLAVALEITGQKQTNPQLANIASAILEQVIDGAEPLAALLENRITGSIARFFAREIPGGPQLLQQTQQISKTLGNLDAEQLAQQLVIHTQQLRLVDGKGKIFDVDHSFKTQAQLEFAKRVTGIVPQNINIDTLLPAVHSLFPEGVDQRIILAGLIAHLTDPENSTDKTLGTIKRKDERIIPTLAYWQAAILAGKTKV